MRTVATGKGSRTEQFTRLGCANVRAGPYAVAAAWCCGMMPTMLNVDPLCISQVRTPKWGDAASESLVSTIMMLDPDCTISCEGVLRKNASTVCKIWLRDAQGVGAGAVEVVDDAVEF
jgi:hypothetical protein